MPSVFITLISYSPGILPPNTPQRKRNIKRARQHQARMDHKRTPQSSAVGGGVPFILSFPIAPPVAPLQIPPAPVGDNPFVGALYNARKNEIQK